MAKRNSAQKNEDIFSERSNANALAPADSAVHIYGSKSVRCKTDSRGYPTPKNKSPLDLVVDASQGFIPLWHKGETLRWRFDPSLYNFFSYPDAAMKKIRELFAKGLMEWGDAPPIKFSESNDAWDFEITVERDNCNYNGCTLARAFFPDSGQHQLVIYPKLFTQTEQEQIETMAHELGHVFGLRHFFAEVKEKAFPSAIFGQHSPFTIMNYGSQSIMTQNDRDDLKKLYEMVWNGELTEINGTPIVTCYPYHTLGDKTNKV